MPTAARVALATWLSALLVAVLVSDAQGIVTVGVSDAFGAPGGTANVTVSVNGGNGEPVAVGLDLFFDASGLDIATTDCVIASRLAATHTLAVFLPVDPAPPGQRRLRLLVVDPSPPSTSFTDGDIATCTFSIAPGTMLGTIFPLTFDPERLQVVDASVPPMALDSIGADGSITVGEGLATLCPGAPRDGCRSSIKSLLVIKNKSKDKKDTITWKWVKGAATTRGELADPTSTASYALCVYASDALVMSIEVGPSATLWKAIKQKGFKYEDKTNAVNGVGAAVLKAGKTGKAKAVMKGKGASLPDLALDSLLTPIRAQLINSSTGVCLESSYDAGAIIKQSRKKLKAKLGP